MHTQQMPTEAAQAKVVEALGMAELLDAEEKADAKFQAALHNRQMR